MAASCEAIRRLPSEQIDEALQEHRCDVVAETLGPAIDLRIGQLRGRHARRHFEAVEIGRQNDRSEPEHDLARFSSVRVLTER